MDLLTTSVSLLVGLVLGGLIGLLWARSRPQDAGIVKQFMPYGWGG